MARNTTQGGSSVYVAGISGNMRNISTELRLDGANGYHKFLFVNKGNGQIMIDGRTQGFGPNTLIFIPDECPHSLTLGVNTHAYAVAVPINKEIPLPTESLVLSVEQTSDTTSLNQLFDTTLREYQADNLGALTAVESYIGLMTVQANRLCAEREQCPTQNASERLMSKFAYLVEQQFNKGQNLETFAKQLNVTPTHLTRVCQKLNNKSASHFVQDRIISEARRMLLVTNLKVQDIAESLGFTSAAYFSRFFANHLHMSPKEFRKSRDSFRQSNARVEGDQAIAI